MRTILFYIFTLFIMSGCGNSTDKNINTKIQQSDSGTIRIALQPNFECLPLIVAKEKGMFDSCGVKVTLKSFYSQIDCDTAMSGNSVDAMVTDIIRGAFWEKENKRKLKYQTWTNSYYMLVSSKKARIKELSQMTDKLIAVTRYSITDMLADSAIQRAGKTPEEMFKVQINNQETRLNMLIENKMDAAFLQHPYAAEAISKGGSVLMHGGESSSGVLAFNSDVDSVKVNKIIIAYDDACNLINNKGVMYFAPLVEKYMHKDIRKWEKFIGNIKFKSSSKVDLNARHKAIEWLKDN